MLRSIEIQPKFADLLLFFFLGSPFYGVVGFQDGFNGEKKLGKN